LFLKLETWDLKYVGIHVFLTLFHELIYEATTLHINKDPYSLLVLQPELLSNLTFRYRHSESTVGVLVYPQWLNGEFFHN
jgi:hypothetical protein